MLPREPKLIRFLLWQSALLVVGLFASGARAEPTESDRATARELAVSGHRALKRGDYATAADRFERADALVHAPTLVVDWGRALAGLGLLVEAGEKYALVIREGVARDAPRSWHRARSDARAEFAALQPRLSWLTLDVSGPETPTITIDGARLPDATLGVARATNPGTREIRVRAPGYFPELRSVTLAEGARERLEIELVPRPAKTRARPLPPPASAPERSGTRRVLTYAAFAAGGVGLVVGGVTGAMALDQRSELEAACRGDVCPASQRDALEDYHRLGVASGIGLGIAALGIGTGVTLLLTEPSQPASDTGSKRATGVWPYLGAGTVGAIGRY